MPLGREPIAVDDGIVVNKAENTRLGIPVLCDKLQSVRRKLLHVGSRRVAMNERAYLWFRGDTTDFYPTEPKVEQACGKLCERFERSNNRVIPSTASPFLSKPAAKPTGFDRLAPHT